jgi:hypothetical protein
MTYERTIPDVELYLLVMKEYFCMKVRVYVRPLFTFLKLFNVLAYSFLSW